MEIDCTSTTNHSYPDQVRETQQGEQLQSHQEEHERQDEHKDARCSTGAVAAEEDTTGATERRADKEPREEDARRVRSRVSPLDASAMGSCGNGVSASTSQATEVQSHQQMSMGKPAKHDVFMNHRGPDTKKTFVAQLEKELRRAGRDPFLDVKSLVEGGHALDSINEALSGVLVHVAVFSPGYVESKYCLNELYDMLESEKPLIPVFYDVEPENLRVVEEGPFAEAFHKHLRKGRDMDVVKWAAALRQAAERTGLRRRDYAES